MDESFKAHLRGQKSHDDWDAYQVEALRELGRVTGQRRHYERQVRKYLKSRGYTTE